MLLMLGSATRTPLSEHRMFLNHNVRPSQDSRFQARMSLAYTHALLRSPSPLHKPSSHEGCSFLHGRRVTGQAVMNDSRIEQGMDRRTTRRLAHQTRSVSLPDNKRAMTITHGPYVTGSLCGITLRWVQKAEVRAARLVLFSPCELPSPQPRHVGLAGTRLSPMCQTGSRRLRRHWTD